MSLAIIKGGLLDTVQDGGRFGWQHQGINPSGVMDPFSAPLANALLGKDLAAPVIEMHFPAPVIRFQKQTIFCLAGANFRPLLDGEEIALYQPVAVPAGAVLSFSQKQKGARCYLALLPALHLDQWLNSYSTNLKAMAGGYHGRKLEKGDKIGYHHTPFRRGREALPLPWKYHAEEPKGAGLIDFVPGPEWHWLTTKAQTVFLNEAFAITAAADRMGYRLQGETLEPKNTEQLLSSGVNFGTVQLLPGGQLILLMADHQTTGGYPRIANVVRAHLTRLAQLVPGDKFRFAMSNTETATEKWMAQQKLLQQLQNTCKHKLETWLHAHRH